MKLFLIVFVLILHTQVFGQVPSKTEKIRIQIWTETDAYPSSEEAAAEALEGYDFPVNQLKRTAPLIFDGMVFGWNFVYVPSDKARAVEEYFEISEICSFDPYISRISYDSPKEEDNTLSVWCEYTRTEAQIQDFLMWSSIKNPVIRGRGYGELSDGFDGYTSAIQDAIKNAIREHYRKILKNKPKEITGSILLRNEPLAGIDAGRYVVNLDFYLQNGKIVQYSTY